MEPRREHVRAWACAQEREELVTGRGGGCEQTFKFTLDSSSSFNSAGSLYLVPTVLGMV